MSYDTNRTNVSLSQLGIRAPNTAPAVGSIIYVPTAGGGWEELAISVPAANVRNALGIDNGETAPSWKTTLDATTPAAVDAAGSPGTSLIYSHRDHVHPQDAALSAIDFLVGTATGELSAEIVVGTAPGGELGGTWASPTVDATHSGSAHHNAITIGADGEHSLSTQVLSGVDATTSQKGHASFSSVWFAVASGVITLQSKYKARATRNTDQTITNSTATLIQFATEDYDLNGNYDNVTNFDYTAPITGYYEVSGNVSINAPAADSLKTAIIYIYVNGSVKTRGNQFNLNTGATSDVLALVVHDLIKLTANDTVTIRAAGITTLGGNPKVNGDVALNHFSIHLLSVD